LAFGPYVDQRPFQQTSHFPIRTGAKQRDFFFDLIVLGSPILFHPDALLPPGGKQARHKNYVPSSLLAVTMYG
jgi:hypothetical protein